MFFSPCSRLTAMVHLPMQPPRGRARGSRGQLVQAGPPETGKEPWGQPACLLRNQGWFFWYFLVVGLHTLLIMLRGQGKGIGAAGLVGMLCIFAACLFAAWSRPPAGASPSASCPSSGTTPVVFVRELRFRVHLAVRCRLDGYGGPVTFLGRSPVMAPLGWGRHHGLGALWCRSSAWRFPRRAFVCASGGSCGGETGGLQQRTYRSRR